MNTSQNFPYIHIDHIKENNLPYNNEEYMFSPYIKMNGQEVYKFATRQVPNCIKEALDKAQLTVEDIDLFVLHQV